MDKVKPTGSGYDHIIEPLVQRGFVVFAADVKPDLGPDPAVPRSEQVRCSLRWITQQYAERDHLGECFSLIGHSNGAAGSVVAAVALAALDDPLADRLSSIVAIAPSTVDNDLPIFAEDHPAALVITGTHDQNDQAPLSLYEIVGDEATLRESAPDPSSVPGRVGEKVLVEAYDVAHSAFGGGLVGGDLFYPGISTNQMGDKGHAIAAAYVPPFLFWQMFGETSWRPRFVDNQIPAGLDADEWWDHIPQWDDTPLIYSAYQAGDRRGVGIRRFPVATMEESNTEPTMMYAGEGTRNVDPAFQDSVRAGRQDTLYPANETQNGEIRGSPFNNALRVDWDSGTGPGGLRWDFAFPSATGQAAGFEPTHLSLRINNVFDGWLPSPPSCQALPSEIPMAFDIRIEDAAGEVAAARIENIPVEDHGNFGIAQFCDNNQSLYTVRIPLSCFEADGVDVAMANLRSLRLDFGTEAPFEGSVVIDSIEFTSSDEEDLSSPNCGHLGAAPSPLVSYACAGYEPANYVTFSPGGSGPLLGELDVDDAFASFVAERPSVVTACDDTRYELDTVQTDVSHDVRSLDAVSPGDLVALLGLQEGDAAITINEPGKPPSNAVELYDYGSFLAALRRFSALEKLEVRFLRATTGVHEPLQINANAPASVRRPTEPVPPSPYLLPGGATYVSSSTDLVNALALPTGQDIIVVDGDYTWTGPVTVAGPHRVWGETLLGATIHFGLTYAGNADRTGGLELHGLAFELDNASMAPAGVGSTHILFTWGQGGEDVLVEDCRFDGDLTVGDAIGAFAPNGLVVRRTELSNFWGYGIVAKQGAAGTVLGSEPLLEDLTIRSVFGANPGSSNGAWENGILLGNNGTIRRVDIRDVGWSAIQLYNDATGVRIEDVFIDYAGPGVWGTVYLQARGAGIWLAQSHDVEVERVRIEAHVFLGINIHWDGGNGNPFLNTAPPRNHNIAISNLYSRAYKIGVHLDLGVEDTVVRSSRFEHAWMAGIVDNNRFEDDWGWHPCPGAEEVCLESSNRTEDVDCYLQDGVSCVAHHNHGGPNATAPANWPSQPGDYVQPGGLWNRNNAAYPTSPGGGGSSSGAQVDSSTSG